jgi:DNA-binding GntR family transcriptional regulator
VLPDGPPIGLANLDGNRIEPRRFGYDQVYRLLRRAVLTRQITPGTRLVEVELAARLGVSRTPVREALRKLESDGFATRARGGGLEATQISAQEIADLFLVRGELDRLAARLACERANPDDWAGLRAQVTGLTVAQAGSELFSDLHLQIHAAIYSLAFGARFAGLLDAHVLQYLEAAAELSYASPLPVSTAVEDHQRLVDDLSSGDVTRAMAAADEHVRDGAADAAHARRASPSAVPS